MFRPGRLSALPLATIFAACATTPPGTAATPARSSAAGSGSTPVATIARAPLPPANHKLPPVPEVEGPLRITVVYPERGALIGSRDSNFVFGSVGSGAAGLRINGALVPVWPNGSFMGWVQNPPAAEQWYDIVAYTLTDTARLRFPVRTLSALPPRAPARPEVTVVSPPATAVLWNDSLARAVSDTDNVIIGRPTPTGTYQWFLFPGTPVRVTEYRGDMARVELGADTSIWVARRDIRPDSAIDSNPVTLSAPELTASATSVSFALRVATPPAYVVDEDEQSLALTFYNTAATPDTIAALHDPLLAGVSSERRGTRTTFRFDLTRPTYGYMALYHDGVFRLDIRRPPVVNAAAPLRGMTIVVDPGHPPIGATGPTGLWEPVPTLAVGLRVQQLLEQKGARVVMTRTNSAPVALGDRPIMARRANANALVSIHLNANPDGQNPFTTNGTGTYYFQPHSKPLARAVQQSLVPRLGLRDRGVFFQNLALCRPTWFPSVLAEGLFIIMPDQEAAIRTPEYQEAYARGVVDGLERYFASLAR